MLGKYRCTSALPVFLSIQTNPSRRNTPVDVLNRSYVQPLTVAMILRLTKPYFVKISYIPPQPLQVEQRYLLLAQLGQYTRNLG
jgi:hypothetical protein